MAKQQAQVVKLRVMSMPCCGHQICWINPRLPTYCPECGEQVVQKVRGGILFTDDQAVLLYLKEEEIWNNLKK